MTFILGCVALAFGALDYVYHRDYNAKHADQDPCHTGLPGFLILGIALIISSVL